MVTWPWRRKPHKKSDDGKLQLILERQGIDLVVDVGANIGQTRDRLRRLGFEDTILSIEPLVEAHATLVERAKSDEKWEIRARMALGKSDRIDKIYVNEASDLSSLKESSPALTESLRKTDTLRTESVAVKTLDSIWPLIEPGGSNIMLKLDTQGNEAEILEGAIGSMPSISAILIELSLVPLYDGETTYVKVCHRIESLGYQPVLFMPGFFSQKNGCLLQMDGVFVRR
jgi:FkbM family methyltransferase